MQIVGISSDGPEDSRELAKKYGLPFPLLEDKEHAYSKPYVGFDGDGYPIPGVVIVSRDMRVAFRQIGSATGDRVWAKELLEILDRTATRDVDKQPTVAFQGGYKPLERWQLRAGAVLGSASHDAPEESAFGYGGTLGVRAPLSPYFAGGIDANLYGGSVGYATLTGGLTLRMPFFGDAAAVTLHAPLGVARTFDKPTTHKQWGFATGANLGIEMGLFPGLGVFIESSLGVALFSAQQGGEKAKQLRLGGLIGLTWLL